MSDKERIEANKPISDYQWIPENVAKMESKSPKMEEVYQEIQSVAGTNATVLLKGESGTGKGIIARLIHRLSKQMGMPFVGVHCGAIPDSLLESTLFGHVKGAFTGAIKDKLGKFQVAHNGTIFLDEIGTITPSSQIKLLQILQDRIVQRVGEDETTSVNVRIIAAANEDLVAMCASNRFRTDLFYRLNVYPIEIPPLRDRVDDIPYLLDAFLARLNSMYEKNITGVEPAVLKAFEGYSWPGNIREMENLIERAYIKEKTSTITQKSIPIEIPDLMENGGVPSAQDISDLPLAEFRNNAVAQIEQHYLKALLVKFQGKINESSKAAGISTRQFGKLLSKYDIKKENFKPPSVLNRSQ